MSQRRSKRKAKQAGETAPQAAPAAAAPVEPAVPAARVHLLLCGLLFLAVAAVFMPAVTHPFITYDDPVYVTGNAHVKGGLSWVDVGWALQSKEASNWHPLTWISHMVDYEMFGMEPWGHHLTSVLLHALNAALLFLALRKMTGAVWRSLFVAALFGLHPLHVESVAWVSERKDVLSTCFMMLVLWAYARRQELARAREPSAMLYYGLCIAFMGLGLMSKSMLVTLPCVLLLLDFWPLNRWGPASARQRLGIVTEKIPFLLLSAAASAITLSAQARGGTVATLEEYPWPVRVANALIAYCWYLGKTFVPTRLAVFYPYFVERPSLQETALAGGLLAGITLACIVLARRRPYLLVGWLWFLGTLVPVIGLVQVGGQSKADRYSYVPLVGLFIMGTWAAAGAAPAWARRKQALAAVGGAVLAACAAMTTLQLSYWRDGLTLFHHALDVTEKNWVAHANLSATLSKTSPDEAAREYQEMLKILASFAETYVRKGTELERTPGRLPEAIKDFRTAIGILPVLAGPHNNLGSALARTPGGLAEAAEELRVATRLKPDFASAHFNLATVLAHTPGGQDESIEEYRTVIRLSPDDVMAHFDLGRVLASMPGRREEALAEFEAALCIRPDMRPAREMVERLRPTP